MLNKKTIAVKENDKAKLTREISTMSHAELARIQLAVNQVLLARTLPGILSQIGRVYEIPFTDGRKTLSVILTYEGVRSLRIDLNTVFKGCGGKEVFNEGTDVKNGVLVNLDLYQQVALLKAIIEKKPELAQVLGLYNLRGSIKVYEVLSKAGVPSQLRIWWMWTGERYIEGQNDEGSYPEAGIVTLENLFALKGYRFVYSYINNVYWNHNLPDYLSVIGAAVFGALK